MTEKPRLSFWQIWNMSFGFLGIQFGWGLQMANMSSIYQFLGADEKDIPILWLAAPLTGLIVQPIIGYYSDRTWTRLGRRRPYFLVGAVLASLALIAMPNSPSLWVAAGLLWILDASVNVSMEPFRAFVGDMLPKNQRKSGFAMQSLLIGLGAVLSSALPFVLTNGFGVSKEATLDSPVPPAVKLAFYIGAGVFITAVLVTILTTREYPPENMEEFEAEKRRNAGVGHAFVEIFQGIGSMPTAMKQLSVVQFFTWLALFCMWIYFVPAVGKGVFGGMPLGLHEETDRTRLSEETRWLNPAAALAKAYEVKKAELSDNAAANQSNKPWYGALLQMFGLTPADPDPGERIDALILEGLIREGPWPRGPRLRKRRLKARWCRVSRWRWRSIRWRRRTRPASRRLRRACRRVWHPPGAIRKERHGRVCFSTYNLIAFGFSFVLLAMSRFLPAKRIHLICLAIGACGLISASFVKQPSMLLVSMAGVGVAWASILSMPYAMLANVIPGHKMGFYMGVFNFFIVLPQILAAVALGRLVDSVPRRGRDEGGAGGWGFHGDRFARDIHRGR